MPKNSNVTRYWNTQLHRIKVETDRLHEAISNEERQKSFEIMQVIERTLTALRASIRENMDEKE